MASHKFLSKLLAFFLISMSLSCLPCSSSSTSPNTPGEKDLVSAACKHTRYSEICISSLRSDPRSRTASNIGNLAAISLNLTLSQGMDTLAFINELKSQSPNAGAPFMHACLSDCEEEYSEAIGNLQDAMEALQNKAYDTVGAKVAAAMTDSDTCEDGFREANDSKSPVADKSQYFYKMCSNSLAIVALLN